MNICSSCGSCSTPNKVNTDRIRLKSLKNIVYRNVNKEDVNNFQIYHFTLYYLCPVCGFTTSFSRDETPYVTIKFMANYPCYNCFTRSGFDGFMAVISPDELADWDPNNSFCVTEDEFNQQILNAVLIKKFEDENPHIICGNA